jgi:hypothetical protein
MNRSNVLNLRNAGWRFGLMCLGLLGSLACYSQASNDNRLEKMPGKLETDFALSALPPHLRKEATVYLLDPNKGYYLAHKGNNGFMCFVARTEWEWAFFSKDVATPMSFDDEGFKTIFRVYRDVETMRASGKFTAIQVKDSVVKRMKNGIYRAPRKGISYMLGPLMRNYQGDPGDNKVTTMTGPHYMFYAPFLQNKDIGASPQPENRGPFIVNNGDTWLGKGKGPDGCIIMLAGSAEKAKILADNQELLKRLVAYKAYFKTGSHQMN